MHKIYQFIFWSALLGSTALKAENTDIIHVSYDHHVKNIKVRQCFQQAPAQLSSYSSTFKSNIKDLQWTDADQSLNLSFKYDGVRLPKGQSGCVQYQLDYNSTASNGSNRMRKTHPRSLLLETDDWLFELPQHDATLPQVWIQHDTTTGISAPWKLLSRTAVETRYQIKPSPEYSSGYVAIGPLHLTDVMIGKQRLRLAVMSGTREHQSELLTKWVKKMAQSVADIGHKFPLDDIQVLVIFGDGRGGVVPWGQVNRAGGTGVLFVVNPEKGEQRLMADWTAAHEFSHLLTPYTPYDRWLSEGFASYHQNITRLRSGLLDEQTAWEKLAAGFARGYESAAKINAPRLKDASQKHNMQMYWGGAVLALQADVTLQQASGGQMNLSKALAGLQACCLSTGQGWSAEQLFTELDRISQTDVFMTLYQQEVLRNKFPDYQSLLKSLGVDESYYGEVVLRDDAPLSAIRKSIEEG